jgi:DNA polymerase
MSQGNWPNYSSSLENLAKRLWPDDETKRKGDDLKLTYGKRDLSPEIAEKLGDYCINDVELTYAAYTEMLPHYPQSELDLINLTIRMYCEPHLVVDKDLLDNHYNDEVEKRTNILLNAPVPREILSSNDKFAVHITSLGIEVPYKLNKNDEPIPAFAANDRSFQDLQKAHPEHTGLWEARIATKSRIGETRARRFIDATHSDGTISVPLNYYGAHTGRYSGGQKINMQNLGRNSPLRKVLCAPTGNLLYVSDLSQIEARVLAFLADEKELLYLFASGQDVYSNFASGVFGHPVNSKDNPIERFLGKVSILGLGFGMGWNRYRETVETGVMGKPMPLSEIEARKIVSTYRTNYWRITHLWTQAERFLACAMNPDTYGLTLGPVSVQENRIILPNDMSLHYPDLEWNGKAMRYRDHKKNSWIDMWGGKIVENIVQALARIVITDAILHIEKISKANNYGLKVVHTVHDEIIVSAPDDSPDETMELIHRQLKIPPTWAPNLPLDAEGGYDTRYSK